MTFESYHGQAWRDHGTKAETVANEFSDRVSLIETNQHLTQFAALVTHVMGEHLERWADGVDLLTKLKVHPQCTPGSEGEKSILRSIAILQTAGELGGDLKSFGVSDRARILATAASALCGQQVQKAKDFLLKALDLAKSDLTADDPAYRALAVTGNNLACTLEEKPTRTSEENALMILAAQTGRKYWEMAGTWLEVARAEYRLTMTYLKAKDPNTALPHANLCLQLCEQNRAGDLDMFFAYEAVALVARAQSNPGEFKKALTQAKMHFQRLSTDDQPYCQDTLKKLEI